MASDARRGAPTPAAAAMLLVILMSGRASADAEMASHHDHLQSCRLCRCPCFHCTAPATVDASQPVHQSTGSPASAKDMTRSMPAAKTGHATDDQLSRKVQRTLSLNDAPDMPSAASESPREPSLPPTESPAPDAAAAVPSCRQEGVEAGQEVGELAGYFDELYLPRSGVSADAALMAELMYT